MWSFTEKNKCELFRINVSTPEAGDYCDFTIFGDPDGDFVRTPTIPTILSGSDTTYFPSFPPWEIPDEYNCYIYPLANKKQTFPAGLARIIAGSNVTYQCIVPTGEEKLDYDYFFGPHETYTSTNPNTYMVLCRGDAKFNGNSLQRWDIIKKSQPGAINLTDVSEDAIIYYVWERI